jgi:hypothetical protein
MQHQEALMQQKQQRQQKLLEAHNQNETSPKLKKTTNKTASALKTPTMAKHPEWVPVNTKSTSYNSKFSRIQRDQEIALKVRTQVATDTKQHHKMIAIPFNKTT